MLFLCVCTFMKFLSSESGLENHGFRFNMQKKQIVPCKYHDNRVKNDIGKFLCKQKFNFL